MRNLAGVPAEEADRVVTEELLTAGIAAIPGLFVGEVKTSRGGVLEAHGRAVTLRRAWYCWIATIHGPPVPLAPMRALNDGYGREVRAGGYSGGRDTQRIAAGLSVWHIDTAQGLKAFADWFRGLKPFDVACRAHHHGSRIAKLETQLNTLVEDVRDAMSIADLPEVRDAIGRLAARAQALDVVLADVAAERDAAGEERRKALALARNDVLEKAAGALITKRDSILRAARPGTRKGGLEEAAAIVRALKEQETHDPHPVSGR